MSHFIIFPAIDLRRGQVVRLQQGDPNRETVFSHSPREIAESWHTAGATWIHVVNLDGALSQNDWDNRNAIREINNYSMANQLKIQLGGGIRTIASIEENLKLGITRVILGTAAIRDPLFLNDALRKFGNEKIVVGVDAMDSHVRISGWQENTHLSVLPFVSELKNKGVKTIIFTDINRDGIGTGINVHLTRKIADDCNLDVIASGGVKDLSDVIAVKQAGLSGIIVGRALYDQVIDAHQLFQEQEEE